MRLGITLATVLVVEACSGTPRAGTLTARWGVKDTAEVSLPATARWCVGAQRIDLRARVGDTAFGVALYPTDSAVIAASYPVWARGASVAYRPGAGVAVRWLSKASMEGWWGDSGAVEVTAGWPRIAGHGEARLVSFHGADSTLPMEFSFRGVPLVVDTLCDQRTLPVATPAAADSSGPPAADGVN